MSQQDNPSPINSIEQQIEANSEKTFEEAVHDMSPFEVKNLLVSYAREDDKQSARTLLNAGRGNPNWIATNARSAFFVLGNFAIEESERTMDVPPIGLAGMPKKEGCSKRLIDYLQKNIDQPGAKFLQDAYDYLVSQGYDADDLVMEWSQGIMGCEYPMPDRILDNTQKIVNEYLVDAICDGTPVDQQVDLFATEGGTAAMCYLFYSLKCNFLVNPGDKMALMTPIFTPYLEIPHLNDYDLNVVNINASTMDQEGLHSWQYPDSELEKLADPSIKMLCLVNPSNPPSYAMDEESHKKLVQIVKEKNPNLLIITDDVYGTFVPHYRSVFADLPENTACVYSFSKYFGATGWRLAVIAMAHDNKFDGLIKQLPADKKKILSERYASLIDDISKVRFIDRMVADSRLVALNGTAGLGTPQQVQMSMFALQELMDSDMIYRTKMQQLVEDRLMALWKSLGYTLEPDPLRAGYYSIIDLGLWASRLYSDDFSTWLKKNYESLDIVVRLARDTGIVLMNGPGFDAPDWSVRVSLANLNIDDYVTIGKHVSAMLDEYAGVWKSEQQ